MNEQNYAGNETVLRNDASAGQTIQPGSTMRDGLPLQGSVQTNWAGVVLSLTVFGVILLFAMRQMFGSGPFKRTYNAFKRLSVAVRAVILALSAGAVVHGSMKSGTNEMERASSPPVVLLRSAEQTASAPAAVEFTASQQLAGFALAAVVTNEAFDLSAPTNAVVHDAWLKRGASEDGFWTALDGFPLGTNRRDAVYVSSSGTLSFNKPKSSPTARPMPDGSSIDFLAPLQTVLGIPPQKFWGLSPKLSLRGVVGCGRVVQMKGDAL